jgi:hypothetical protein
VGCMYVVGYGRTYASVLSLRFSIVSVSITGSNLTASSKSFLLRFRLMIQVAITMRNMRPTRPTEPKTTPNKALFCRKAVGWAGLLELIASVCPPADAVKVIVCPATVVTTTGGEWFAEADVEEEDDGDGDGDGDGDEDGDEDEDEDEEVVELDVDEEVVEWVDDVLDLLPVNVVVRVGVGKRSERNPNCLNFKSWAWAIIKYQRKKKGKNEGEFKGVK